MGVRKQGGLWNGLRDFCEGSGCARAADAGGWIEAAFIEQLIRVETETESYREANVALTPGQQQMLSRDSSNRFVPTAKLPNF